MNDWTSCLYCGDRLYTGTMFCSQRCAGSARRNQPPACANCGQEIFLRYKDGHTSKRKYCMDCNPLHQSGRDQNLNALEARLRVVPVLVITPDEVGCYSLQKARGKVWSGMKRRGLPVKITCGRDTLTIKVKV